MSRALVLLVCACNAVVIQPIVSVDGGVQDAEMGCAPIEGTTVITCELDPTELTLVGAAGSMVYVVQGPARDRQAVAIDKKTGARRVLRSGTLGHGGAPGPGGLVIVEGELPNEPQIVFVSDDGTARTLVSTGVYPETSLQVSDNHVYYLAFDMSGTMPTTARVSLAGGTSEIAEQRFVFHTVRGGQAFFIEGGALYEVSDTLKLPKTKLCPDNVGFGVGVDDGAAVWLAPSAMGFSLERCVFSNATRTTLGEIPMDAIDVIALFAIDGTHVYWKSRGLRRLSKSGGAPGAVLAGDVVSLPAFDAGDVFAAMTRTNAKGAREGLVVRVTPR